jgi:hypothetical protein
MSFIKHLKEAHLLLTEHQEPGESSDILPIVETKGTFEDILKSNNLKIKSKIVTDFGTQFEFFKSVDTEFVDGLFPENDVQFKDKFIFVLL